VGFHPWDDVDTLTDDDFILLEQCAHHPQVLAIGETGMDRLRGASLDVQAAVFIRHLQLAAKLDKPVIVHCVRAAQEILAARRQAGLTAVPLAIHGLRANEHVARMLLDAGCYLSFGIRFNPDALRSTPLDRLLIETDDAPVTIQEVADAIAPVLQMSSEQVIKTAAGNAQRLLIK
jgi:TatD DNase family protein